MHRADACRFALGRAVTANRWHKLSSTIRLGNTVAEEPTGRQQRNAAARVHSLFSEAFSLWMMLVVLIWRQSSGYRIAHHKTNSVDSALKKKSYFDFLRICVPMRLKVHQFLMLIKRSDVKQSAEHFPASGELIETQLAEAVLADNTANGDFTLFLFRLTIIIFLVYFSPFSISFSIRYSNFYLHFYLNLFAEGEAEPAWPHAVARCVGHPRSLIPIYLWIPVNAVPLGSTTVLMLS